MLNNFDLFFIFFKDLGILSSVEIKHVLLVSSLRQRVCTYVSYNVQHVQIQDSKNYHNTNTTSSTATATTSTHDGESKMSSSLGVWVCKWLKLLVFNSQAGQAERK